MTGQEQKRLIEIKRTLGRAGWRLRWSDADSQWTAEKHGFLIGNTNPENLLLEALTLDPPKPIKIKKPKQPGKLGRRPRVDLTETLFRCVLEDAHRVPCLALIWRRMPDMREHLSRYHLDIPRVAAMTDTAVSSCYETPLDTPDDGTGESEDA